jgi:NADH dehydrogenase [ubiquinone] 1 alpha subcomplex assembly factor 5
MKQRITQLCSAEYARTQVLGLSSFRQLPQRRAYAVQTPGSPRFQVFNGRTKRLQKERAASNVESSRVSDYLKDEVARRVCHRLLVSNFF